MPLLLAISGLAGAQVEQGVSTAAGLWSESWGEALKRAESKEQPILAYFGRPNCTTCERVEAEILTSPGLPGLARHAVLFRHTTTTCRQGEDWDLWYRLKVGTWGKFLVIAPDGEILSRHVERTVWHLRRAVKAGEALLKQRSGKVELEEWEVELARARLWALTTARAEQVATHAQTPDSVARELRAYALGRRVAAWHASLHGNGGGRPAVVYAAAHREYGTGNRPPRSRFLQTTFWQYVAEGAEAAEDVNALSDAVAWLSHQARSRPGEHRADDECNGRAATPFINPTQGYLASLQARLDRLRESTRREDERRKP